MGGGTIGGLKRKETYDCQGCSDYLLGAKFLLSQRTREEAFYEQSLNKSAT